MIYTSSFNATLVIAERLQAANVSITAHPSSIIGNMEDVAYSPIIDQYQGNDFIGDYQTSISRVPGLGQSGGYELNNDGEVEMLFRNSLYSSSADEASDIIADSVKRALNKARNVVNPIIRTSIDLVNSYVRVAETSREPYDINDINTPKLWEMPIVVSTLEKYQSKVSTLRQGELPTIPYPDGLQDALTTGTSGLDEAFSICLTQTGLSLDDIWDEVFGGKPRVPSVTSPLYLNRNKTLIKFLMCSILQGKPLPGVKLSKLQWESAMVKATNLFGEASRFLLEEIENNRKNRMLVYDIDHAQKVIYVNGDIYDEWLDAGGKPEILIGAALQATVKPTSYSYQVMLDNASQYMRSWTNYHASMRSKDESKRLANFKDGLYNALVRAIDNTDHGHFEDNVTSQVLKERAAQYTNGITSSSLITMETAVVDGVCDVLFPHTPAKDILKNIGKYVDEGYAPEESATLVMVDYIATWIADNMLISRA